MTIEPGPPAVAAVAFLLLAGWCFTHRRVDRSLAALGLYLGLLDGYLKLRTGSPFVTLARDVLVLAIAGGALARALGAHKPLPLPPLGGLVLAFAALVVVEMFNPLGRGVAGGLAGLRQHLEFVPLFFLGYAFIRTKAQVRKLLVLLVVCASVGGVVSFAQSILTPEQFATWGPGYSERVLGTGSFAGAPRVAFEDSGERRVRPFGLGSDIGAGALIGALALPALLALIMVSHGASRLAMIALGVGIALSAATSGTRAALIVFVVCAVTFTLLTATTKVAGRLLAGLLAGILMLYATFAVLGPQNSTTQRAQSITPGKVVSTFSEERGASVVLIGEYAIKFPLGLGVGSVGPAAVRFSGLTAATAVLNGETQWNYLILETGLAGLTIFLWLNVRLMSAAMRRIRRIGDTEVRLQLAALAAPLFGLIVAGFAAPTTATVPQAPYFWLVAGILSYWLIAAYHGASSGAPSARQAGRAPAATRYERERVAASAAAH
jgi:hypothetical protein